MKLYPETKALIVTLLLFFTSLSLLKYTKANFSDSEKLLGNSIEVGVWNSTPSPSGPTNTLTPTSTPTEVPPGEPTITPSLTPTPTNTLTPTLTPTPSNLANHIVISEIQIYGASASQDFIEIYNPTNNSVDLSGWQLMKNTSTGASGASLALIGNGKSIPAHGFFLWANNENGYALSIGADISNGNNLANDNSVALLNKEDQLIDQVAWGTSDNPYIEGTALQNPATNQSLERKAYSTSNGTSMMTGSDATKGNAYDTNNNANDFILRTTSQPQNNSSPIEIP